MAKGSFILQTKHAKRIRELSDADAGKLLKSIFGFVEDTGEEYDLSDRADVIFDYMKEEITEANAAYEKTCKARKAAIDKRWGKSSEADTDTKNTKEYNSIQKNTAVGITCTAVQLILPHLQRLASHGDMQNYCYR